jgi:hypothetical protein
MLGEMVVKPGIEKKQILAMLSGMVQNLEEADSSLFISMTDKRSDLYMKQYELMKEFENQLIILESKASNYLYSSSNMNGFQDAAGLKLELGF